MGINYVTRIAAVYCVNVIARPINGTTCAIVGGIFRLFLHHLITRFAAGRQHKYIDVVLQTKMGRSAADSFTFALQLCTCDAQLYKELTL